MSSCSCIIASALARGKPRGRRHVLPASPGRAACGGGRALVSQACAQRPRVALRPRQHPLPARERPVRRGGRPDQRVPRDAPGRQRTRRRRAAPALPRPVRHHPCRPDGGARHRAAPLPGLRPPRSRGRLSRPGPGAAGADRRAARPPLDLHERLAPARAGGDRGSRSRRAFRGDFRHRRARLPAQAGPGDLPHGARAARRRATPGDPPRRSGAQPRAGPRDRHAHGARRPGCAVAGRRLQHPDDPGPAVDPPADSWLDAPRGMRRASRCATAFICLRGSGNSCSARPATRRGTPRTSSAPERCCARAGNCSRGPLRRARRNRNW